MRECRGPAEAVLRGVSALLNRGLARGPAEMEGRQRSVGCSLRTCGTMPPASAGSRPWSPGPTAAYGEIDVSSSSIDHSDAHGSKFSSSQ
jgi:hypothetical protein